MEIYFDILNVDVKRGREEKGLLPFPGSSTLFRRGPPRVSWIESYDLVDLEIRQDRTQSLRFMELFPSSLPDMICW